MKITTSTLTAKEEGEVIYSTLVLDTSIGVKYTPVGSYSIGVGIGENATASQAVAKATEILLQRLKEKAQEIKADGIFGIRIEASQYGEKGTFLLAYGTAVRSRKE